LLTLRPVFGNANSGLEQDRAKLRHIPNIHRRIVLQGAWGHRSCVLISLPLGFADPDVGRGIKTAVIDLKLALSTQTSGIILARGGPSDASTMAYDSMCVTCIPRLTTNAKPFRRGAGGSTMLCSTNYSFPGCTLGKEGLRAILTLETNRASQPQVRRNLPAIRGSR
jgi:hypothetical protein